MAKTSKKAQEKIGKVMREYKKGKLESGRSGQKVTSQKQAIAIALSEAREAGLKTPAKKAAATKQTASKKTASKKASAKQTASKKTASKKAASKKKA